MGKKVEVRYPIPSIPIWRQRLLKALKAIAITPITVPGPTRDIWMKNLILHGLLGQCTRPIDIGWDPYDGVEEAAHIEVKCPEPTDILTLEVLNELDPDWRSTVVWPTTGKQWSTWNDIAITAAPAMTRNFKSFCHWYQHDTDAYIAAINAGLGTLAALDNAEGPGAVQVDYTPACKIFHTIAAMDLHFPPQLEPWQRKRFLCWVQIHQDAHINPTFPEIIAHAKQTCGFNFHIGPFSSKDEYIPPGLSNPHKHHMFLDDYVAPPFDAVPKSILHKWSNQPRSAQLHSG